MASDYQISEKDRLRFWKKVDKTGLCWIWTASINDSGYGNFWVAGQHRKAHRISYEIANGRSISKGMEIDHTCWNRACVNPKHLREVSHALNAQNISCVRPDSRSGVRGVAWRRSDNKFEAYFKLNGQRVYLGLYETLDEAAEVVALARRRHMTHSLIDQRPSIGSFLCPNPPPNHHHPTTTTPSRWLGVFYCIERGTMTLYYQDEHVTESDSDRRRRLGREKSARYRARLRGDDVPYKEQDRTRPKSAEHRSRIAESLRGENHPRWQGDSVSEKGGRARALRMFPEHSECSECGAEESERHHIDSNTANNSPENIARLCRRCHMKVDGRLARVTDQTPYRGC